MLLTSALTARTKEVENSAMEVEGEMSVSQGCMYASPMTIITEGETLQGDASGGSSQLVASIACTVETLPPCGFAQLPAAIKEVALLAPSVTGACTVEVVQRPSQQLAFTLLRITAHGNYNDAESDLTRSLAACSKAVERAEPLLALYDLRDATMPPFWSSQSLVNVAVEWADAHARQWDTHNQGSAIVLPSAIVRAFLNMITGMLKPPQPVLYCASVDEALDFLGSIREAHSYVKDHYPERS